MQMGILAQIDGHSFAITSRTLACLLLQLQAGTLFVRNGKMNGMQARMDLELGANLDDFASLANGSVDADTLFFQRRLKISGDTDLGLIVKNWLDATERPAWLTRT